MSEYNEIESINDEATQHSRNLSFHGSGWGNFVILVTNMLLTIITLGMYIPWAFVRSKRYFYSNTQLSGSSFCYQGTGSSMFLSFAFIIAFIAALNMPMVSEHSWVVIFMMAVVILFLPYLAAQSLRFQMQMTTLNGVRFNFKTSGMKCWWAMLGCPLLLTLGVLALCALIITVGMDAFDLTRIVTTVIIVAIVGFVGLAVIMGVSVAQWYGLLLNSTSFGKSKFSAKVDIRKCIKICLIGILLWLPFILIAIKMIAPIFALIAFGGISDNTVNEMVGKLFMCEAVYFIGALAFFSYVYVSMRNYIYSLVVLEGNITFRATLTVSGFAVQLILNVLLVVCTFGIGFAWAQVRYVRYVVQNTWFDGDLEALSLEDHDDKTETDIVSCIARGFVPNIIL